MNRVRLALLVIYFCFASAHIYAQVGTGTDVDNDPGDRNCIPAAELEKSPGEESGPSEEGRAADDGAELPVCEEADTVTAVMGEEASIPEPDAEAAPVEEAADPEEEFEVDPEDEISEDYPVPLPSDI